MQPCRCGKDEVFEVDIQNGYRIVGVYGLHSTDKFCWHNEKVRHLENIRSLGFITMQVLF